MSSRSDGRSEADLRPAAITLGVNRWAEGSALVQMGETRVLCTASVEEKVPPFLLGQRQGWVTAEYGMLPRATHTRSQREASRGRPSGRTSEIQRLIGRALRAVVDMQAIGERTLWIDCDVLQADGGTRCASITGSFAALAQALQTLRARGAILIRAPLLAQVAAVSVGIHGGRAVLDLSYEEDSKAEVDMNIVATDAGRYIEIQGTAEAAPFTTEQMNAMLELAKGGLERLFAVQRQALGDSLASVMRGTGAPGSVTTFGGGANPGGKAGGRDGRSNRQRPRDAATAGKGASGSPGSPEPRTAAATAPPEPVPEDGPLPGGATGNRGPADGS